MAQDITYIGLGDFTYKSTEDGTLLVFGKATGPDLDLDSQICDPDWLKSAMPLWFQTGATFVNSTALSLPVWVSNSQPMAMTGF